MTRPRTRVCATPGCPNLITSGSRCSSCQSGVQRAADAARPSSTARGYDRGHRAERLQWDRKVKTGAVTCRRCRQPIVIGEPWDLGHDDNDRSAPRAPEHARCNRATKAHRAGTPNRRR